MRQGGASSADASPAIVVLVVSRQTACDNWPALAVQALERYEVPDLSGLVRIEPPPILESIALRLPGYRLQFGKRAIVAWQSRRV